jgi:hypothetical protein
VHKVELLPVRVAQCVTTDAQDNNSSNKNVYRSCILKKKSRNTVETPMNDMQHSLNNTVSE